MRRFQRLLAPLSIAVLMLLSLGAWALASPVGATPDEDFHLASIWCGAGEREGLCAPGSVPDNRMIPDKIEDSICYAHEPSEGAGCQGENFDDSGYELVDSRRVNSNGQYPTGFYFWNAIFASDNLAVSTLLVRGAQALLFTVLSVSLWNLLPRRNRPALLGGAAITLVPLGMFLIPSANPSGWSIASGVLLLPALVGFFASSGWRSAALAGFAVLAALLGLGSRGDSAAYTIVAVLAALVLTFEQSKRFLVRAVLPVAIMIAAAVSFLTAGQTGLALEGMTQAGTEGIPLRKLLYENFVALPELFAGVLGQNFDGSAHSGLGWLDTRMPALVWVLTTFVFAGVVLAAIRQLGWRRTVALAGVALAAFAVPFYILYQSHVYVGYQVQPRYIMPLITIFAIVALTPTPAGPGISAPRRVSLTTPQYWLVAIALSVANAVALFSNMRRYITPGNFNLNNVDWWWRAAPAPMLVWFVGAAAFAALAALLVIALQRNRAAQAGLEGVGSPRPATNPDHSEVTA